MEVLAHLQYTRTHDWLEAVSPYRVRIGVTDYAQDLLGVIVFVELPDLDTMLEVGQSYGCLESVKTVTDLCSPVAGRVVALNSRLLKNPEFVNIAPYTDGWLIEIEFDSQAPITPMQSEPFLLSATQYQALFDSTAT